MILLRLPCPAEDVDFVSAELWDAGTAGIQQIEEGERITLIASFENEEPASDLLDRLSAYSPTCEPAEGIHWAEESQKAWPARTIGERIFLAPPWSTEPTPAGRERIIHIPGLACGTGEHPCTQLALIALEKCIMPACGVVDVGTGSGIVAIAALRLGVRVATGVDTDASALDVARDNLLLNGFEPLLIAGSVDTLADACSHVTVANISGTVLLSMMDDLIRITRPGGWLILTGFPEAEAGRFREMFSETEILSSGEWRCVIVRF